MRNHFADAADQEVLKKYIVGLNGANASAEDLSVTLDTAATKQEKFNKSIKSIGLKGILGKGLKLGASMFGNIAASLIAEKAFEVGAQAIYNWVHAADIAIEKGQEGQKVIAETYEKMQEIVRNNNRT